MFKNIVKYSLFVSVTSTCSLLATDFHAPLPGAPLRYEFKRIQKNKSVMNFWSNAYYRAAEKAFIEDCSKSKPLSALIFGKSNFNIAQSFQNATDDNFGLTQNQNPYIGTVNISPRVSYSEEGVVIGGSWEYPVWKNKGCIGARVAIPFRDVHMEKDNDPEETGITDQRKIIEGDVRAINPTNASLGDANPGNAPLQLTNIGYYNLKFLSKIKIISDNQGHVVAMFGKSSTGNNAIGNQDLPTVAQINTGNLGNNSGTLNAPPMLIIRAQNTKTPPVGRGGGIWFDKNTNPAQFVNVAGGATHIAYVPQTGNVILNTNTAAPAGATLMTPAATLADAGTGSAVVLAADTSYPLSDITNDLWVTTIHGAATGTSGDPVGTSLAAKTLIDNTLGLYNNNNQTLGSWLNDRGYEFKNYNLIGIGDIDVDFFYNHQFSNHFVCEGYLGIRLPTGAADIYYGNPYRMYLGNGNHVELKIGADAAWKISKRININADIHYNSVIEATEHRMAAYKGATIKNMGPKANADVDWSYFTGNINVTWCHKKTNSIATTVGYEFYYKTRDHIHFKHTESTKHWLGASWVQADGQTPADASHAGTQYVILPMKLDGNVASMKTEGIGHRAYFEGSYKFSEYLAFSTGGRYTFAGKNIPCEGDVYTGINVKF